ncbi:Erythronate-4-phosphate dehydrogenase [Microbulbifer aggregans]|uniref:Erythronate-4-phosphate dehydrogenase n=1 Tax=Microbulbifer aggregans TaxID=1769779 RepID=A0A1C9W8T8_9GAMM|nr:4-phosphoerythronate dehydrogenase [Microbulbifer aggregans]AOS97550.1 Erythronate-4-phosphate dehydrogenase [Microbulbifer aggregans]
MREGKIRIVADENIPAVEHYFGDLGSVRRLPGRTMSREQLLDADVLLVRSVTPVNRELLEGTPVGFVGSCTIGTDHLDTQWLDRQGIPWSAAPGCNANSVVEYVFCALAALGRDWRGQRFGIVGCGNVGGSLQQRLHGLGIECRVYDPWLPENPDAADLDEVMSQDVVCLHAPLVKGGPHPSLHMIDAERLAGMKDGAVLISAGRGAVVDNSALLALLESGKPLTTVLDVWENEPDIDTALLSRVDIGTPHIAGYSHDGKLAGTRMVREALSNALGLPPVVADSAFQGQIHSLIPSAAAKDSDGEFATMADLLLQMYDPRGDDRRLRAAANAELNLAQGFDRLRREYPRRLEFSHYRGEGGDLAAESRRQLEILGLKWN